MFKALRSSLLSIFFPQPCLNCSGHVESVDDGVACSQCWAATRVFRGSERLCSKCGAVLSGIGGNAPVRCHQCDGHHYERAAAAGVYEGALASTVIALKRVPKLGRRASNTFIEAFAAADLGSTTLIVPVPLSPRRRHERGFNQADILAKILSSATGLPVDEHSLVRTVHSPMHRVAMDNRARELTVQNAFEVKRPKLVAGHAILLVDDVLTSGATTSNCAEILLKSGALAVNVLTLARAVTH